MEARIWSVSIPLGNSDLSHHPSLRTWIQPHPAIQAEQDPEGSAEHLSKKPTAYCLVQFHFPVGLSFFFFQEAQGIEPASKYAYVETIL